MRMFKKTINRTRQRAYEVHIIFSCGVEKKLICSDFTIKKDQAGNITGYKIEFDFKELKHESRVLYMKANEITAIFSRIVYI